MNLSQVLLDIHTFLKEHPYHVWKTRPDNTPLRTIKTILHSLAKLKGNDVSSVLLWVKVSRESFGVQYNVLQLVRLCHFLLRFLPLTPTPPNTPNPYPKHTHEIKWSVEFQAFLGGGVLLLRGLIGVKSDPGELFRKIIRDMRRFVQYVAAIAYGAAGTAELL